MLLAGGVDYNKGLGGFGWYSKTCLGLYRTDVLCSLSREKIEVDLIVLRRALRQSRNRKTLDASCNAFIAELNNALYCLAYYVWFDDGRGGAAGPRVVNVLKPLVPDQRISFFLSMSGVPAVATIYNTWPGQSTPYAPLEADRSAEHARFAFGGCCR